MTTWLPVESDSEIITQYAHKLGMIDTFEFIDLFSFDPKTAIEFGIPVNQCKGMILLYPFGAIESEFKVENESDLKEGTRKIKFISQTIENSCCLMALLHILLNNPSELLTYHQDIPLSLQKLVESEAGLEGIIENSDELKEIHEEMAGGGESDLTVEIDNVLYHFVAIIPKESNENSASAYLMDGRLSGPIKFDYNGDSMNFFEMACKIANEEFLQKSTDQTNFAAVILV